MNVGRRSEKLAREERLEDVSLGIFGHRIENGAVDDPERVADVSVGRTLEVRHGLLEALAHLRCLPFQCGLKGDGIGRLGEPDVLLRHRGLFAVTPEGDLDALDLEPEHLPHVLFAHVGRECSGRRIQIVVGKALRAHEIEVSAGLGRQTAAEGLRRAHLGLHHLRTRIGHALGHQALSELKDFLGEGRKLVARAVVVHGAQLRAVNARLLELFDDVVEKEPARCKIADEVGIGLGLFSAEAEGVGASFYHGGIGHAGRDLLAHELIVRGRADGLRACGEGAKHEDGGKNLLHESSGKGQGELQSYRRSKGHVSLRRLVVEGLCVVHA